jgi:hypothetical protein
MRASTLLIFAISCAFTSGCGFLKKKDSGADASASTETGASARATTVTAPMNPPKRSLDATACNPGTSLNPPDKGKSFQSDQFKYTLLDVRTDAVTNPAAPYKTVVLVKLQVENITSKPDLNLSVAEVDCSRDKAGPDRVKERELLLKNDLFYDRPKMCVDLGGAVTQGTFPAGAKVVGYYAYAAPDPLPKSLYFDARNMAAEAVSRGNLLKVAGSFSLK